MEKIYFESQKKGSSFTAYRQTIQFLISYSKSLRFVEHNNIQFEISLN